MSIKGVKILHEHTRQISKNETNFNHFDEVECLVLRKFSITFCHTKQNSQKLTKIYATT